MPMPDFDDLYQPPEAMPEPSGPLPTDPGLFLRWEKLRVFYNLILTAVVLLVWAAWFRAMIPIEELLFASVLGALGANVCYCAGPVANAYAYWLGWRHPAVTVVLFVAGTGLSVLAAVVSVAGIAGGFLP